MTANMRRILIGALMVSGLSAIATGRGQVASSRPAQPVRTMTLGLAGAVNATPSLAVAGRTVAAVWTATKDGATNVYVAVSNDAGGSFSEPKRVNDQDGDATANNEQPPRISIGGSPRAVTVVWSKRNEGPQRARRDTLRMARSVDGGRTFSPARFTHEPGLSGARGWESLASGGGGTVHAVWLDGRDAEKKIAEAAHSGAAHKGPPPQDTYHGTIAPDGRVVETVIATGVCFCCKTTVAVDGRGVVYAAWRHIFPGSMRDIAFARSADGGRRFEPLVRVSEDNWQLNGCPEDGPTLAVDQAGVIHIAWSTVAKNEERKANSGADGDGEPTKALFYATSRDGKTFSPRARISTAQDATPGHPQLALASDRSAAIVWDELVEGVRRVSFTRVSPTGVFRPAQILSAGESASNPVIVPAGTNLLVAWTSRSAAAKSPAEPSMITVRRMGPV